MQINDGSKPRQDFSEFIDETLKEREILDNENLLKEMAHWYGGWSELRKVIDRLEDNHNEAAFERSQNEPEAWAGGFADNH